MKKIIVFISSLFIFIFLLNVVSFAASYKSFNISSKEKFLGSLFENLLEVNNDFRDIDNPYYNPEIHKYGLAINDVLKGNNNFENILSKRNIHYTINNNSTNVATIYSAVFVYQKNDLYPYGYTDKFERLKLKVALDYNGDYMEWSSSMYYRYLTASSIYGYESNYTPILTFEYSLNNKEIYIIRMIETRKLIIWNSNNSEDKFEITKQEHYNRNVNNPTDVPAIRDTDAAMILNYGMSWDGNAYFHKIGEFDGDTSNINNVKHTCNIGNGFKYEFVYSGAYKGAKLITSPTVMGTYNFASPTDSDKHRIKDVLPYLIWGNAVDDNTSLKERFYFDYDDFQKGKNYTKRGASLFTSINLNSYLNIDLDTLNNRFKNPVVDETLYI